MVKRECPAVVESGRWLESARPLLVTHNLEHHRPPTAAISLVLLDFLREGDTLAVTRIDRLARSMNDLQDIVHGLKGMGALKATEQPIERRVNATGTRFYSRRIAQRSPGRSEIARKLRPR